ncbi:MAG TPA: alpha/beta hydrolase [Vicinamibacterales bacterium]|nr:alpha/beta hydrolase [Vicinamibacterales bacterium]
MIVRGAGPPLVLIPGVQGRWEWMRPAVEALAASFTVATFSLIGERGTGCRLQREAAFDRHADQVDEVLDRAGWQTAAICGVSYGGLVAVRYAALRPERTSTLVLVSAPGPRWRPNARVSRYVSSPWASLPAFVLGAPWRLWPEMRAAYPTLPKAFAGAARHLLRVASAPAWPPRMARRLEIIRGHDFLEDARRVDVPTLVITGEDHLDYVVPVEGTLEYARVIPGAATRALLRTGHLGIVTRPQAFCALVAGFVEECKVSAGPDDLRPMTADR